MIGVHLLLVAAAVATVAPRVLARAGWGYRSPRLGIAAWYAVLAAVTSAVAAAVVSLAAPWRRGEAPVCVAWPGWRLWVGWWCAGCGWPGPGRCGAANTCMCWLWLGGARRSWARRWWSVPSRRRTCSPGVTVGWW